MINVELLASAVLNGFSIGMTLIVPALGLQLIFGLMHVANFAHGNFFALGAYVAYSVVLFTGNFWLAIPISGIVVAGLGAIIEPTLLRRIYNRPVVDSLIVMFGVLLLTYDLIEVTWGSVGIPFSGPKMLARSIGLGIVEYPAYRIFQILASGTVAFLLWLFLKKTELGLLIRAGVQNREMVQALGIKIKRIFLLSFCIAVGIAGVAGVLAAPLMQLFPFMGNDIIIKIFIIVVLGGIGSIRGAVVAGLTLGLASAFAALVWPPLSEIIMYLLMGLIIIIRPGGILGEGEVFG
jgi:branched-chain amino acid transport system permease protein